MLDLLLTDSGDLSFLTNMSSKSSEGFVYNFHIAQSDSLLFNFYIDGGYKRLPYEDDGFNPMSYSSASIKKLMELSDRTVNTIDDLYVITDAKKDEKICIASLGEIIQVKEVVGITHPIEEGRYQSVVSHYEEIRKLKTLNDIDKIIDAKYPEDEEDKEIIFIEEINKFIRVEEINSLMHPIEDDENFDKFQNTVSSYTVLQNIKIKEIDTLHELYSMINAKRNEIFFIKSTNELIIIKRVTGIKLPIEEEVIQSVISYYKTFYKLRASSALEYSFYTYTPEYNKEMMTVSSKNYIQQCIKIRLNTELDTIRENTDMGCNLHTIIHSNIPNNKLKTKIEEMIKESIQDILPNASVSVSFLNTDYLNYHDSIRVVIVNNEDIYYYTV